MELRGSEADELIEGGPGVRLGYVEAGRDSGDRPLKLPLAVITGERSGNTVWVNASLHGDEYLGPAAILALISRLDPPAVRGRVVLTPALNPGALRAMQRADPEQPGDLNRLWSVEARKGASPAAIRWAESAILPRIDAVVDLHSGGNRFLQAPFAAYPNVGGEVDRRSSALAKACGLARLWAHRGSILEGALVTAAARNGKPAVLIELEGEGKAEPRWVDAMVAAIEGALAHLGVIRGATAYLPSYDVFGRLTSVRNREAGLWSRAVEPGQPVHPGDALGQIRDLLGRERERVTAAEDAVVVGICTYGYAPADEYLAELAHEFHREGPPA